MKIKKYFFLIFLSVALGSCQSVTNKIDQTTELEKKELSKWLNRPESDLKRFYGQPDKVEFLKQEIEIIFTSQKNIKSNVKENSR